MSSDLIETAADAAVGLPVVKFVEYATEKLSSPILDRLDKRRLSKIAERTVERYYGDGCSKELLLACVLSPAYGLALEDLYSNKPLQFSRIREWVKKENHDNKTSYFSGKGVETYQFLIQNEYVKLADRWKDGVQVDNIYLFMRLVDDIYMDYLEDSMVKYTGSVRPSFNSLRLQLHALSQDMRTLQATCHAILLFLIAYVVAVFGLEMLGQIKALAFLDDNASQTAGGFIAAASGVLSGVRKYYNSSK